MVNNDLANKYLTNLRYIKLHINGKSLIENGIEQSKNISLILDYVMEQKLANPNLTYEEELNMAKKKVAGTANLEKHREGNKEI